VPVHFGKGEHRRYYALGAEQNERVRFSKGLLNGIRWFEHMEWGRDKTGCIHSFFYIFYAVSYLAIKEGSSEVERE